MTNELLRNMLKEEWRIHSTLFGSIRFAFFPLVIILIGFVGSWTLSVFQVMFSISSLFLFVHYLFLFFGANIGAFGLMGREFMNRRFGQASLIAYATRTLPVGERRIFINVIIKDMIYYLFLWIVPLILGFAIAAPIIHLSIAYVPLLLLTLSLSFLIGMSIVFFFSMIYARSTLGFIILAVVSVIAGFFTKNVFTSFAPYAYFVTKDIKQIFISIAAILILSTIAAIFAKFDFPYQTNKFQNSLKKWIRRFSFSRKYSVYVAKDFLDLRRSDGGLGKLFFSFLLPMGFVWFFLTFFTKYFSSVNFLVLFALFLGIFSSSIYTWLTEYDLFNQYLFLPVKVSTIIKSKLLGYIVINTVSVALLILAAILKQEFAYLLLSILLFAIMSFFALSITIYYAGLSPSLMFMDAKVIVQYLGTIIPLMLLLIFGYVFGITYLIIEALVIFVATLFIIRAAFRKWDRLPQQTF